MAEFKPRGRRAAAINDSGNGNIAAPAPSVAKMSDNEIIAAYPNASPQELLVKHGLSEAGFDALVERLRTNTAPQPKGILTPSYANVLKAEAQPITSAHVSGNNRDVVRLVPIGSGIGSTVPRHRAMKLMAKFPNKYRIA